jgi:hypothetical protein
MDHKEFSSRGGKARALKLSRKERKAIAALGGKERAKQRKQSNK